MLIISTKNEIVKSVRRLRDRSARRESGQHLIEGERLVFDALEAGIVPETLFIEQGRTDFEARVSALGAEFFSVSRAVLETVCDTSAPQGIAAAVRTPDLTAPESAEDFPHGLIAALDALQDPGNLGTIIRTADAMGAAAVLLGGQHRCIFPKGFACRNGQHISSQDFSMRTLRNSAEAAGKRVLACLRTFGGRGAASDAEP